MTGRSKALFSLLVLAALVWGALAYRGGEATSPLPAYAVATIERGEIVASVSATGALSPLITVQVGSQVSGRIHRLYADFK